MTDPTERSGNDAQSFSNEQILIVTENQGQESSTVQVRQPLHINDLMPELLSSIFLKLMSHLTRGDEDGDPYAWLYVTEVCKLWHDVALSCPALWSSISPSFKPEVIEMLLKRSKSSLLDIDLDISPKRIKSHETAEKIISLVNRTHDRTGQLEIRVWDGIIPLVHISDISFPRLQDLRINCYALTGLPLKIPGDLLPNDLRSLKKVSLEFCQTAWNAPIFAGLTSLSLCFVSGFEPSNTLNMNSLLTILEKCPALEELSLVEHQYGDELDGFVFPHYVKQVPLIRLRNLQIKTGICQLAILLRLVKLPTNFDWDISCFDVENKDVRMLVALSDQLRNDFRNDFANERQINIENGPQNKTASVVPTGRLFEEYPRTMNNSAMSISVTEMGVTISATVSSASRPDRTFKNSLTLQSYGLDSRQSPLKVKMDGLRRAFLLAFPMSPQILAVDLSSPSTRISLFDSPMAWADFLDACPDLEQLTINLDLVCYESIADVAETVLKAMTWSALPDVLPPDFGLPQEVMPIVMPVPICRRLKTIIFESRNIKALAPCAAPEFWDLMMNMLEHRRNQTGRQINVQFAVSREIKFMGRPRQMGRLCALVRKPGEVHAFCKGWFHRKIRRQDGDNEDIRTNENAGQG
ncbi:hypothetical protein DFH11DRAFT_1727331 [Phellopilus nigrolimitatus]|nr:hypothetical protein DFH11DRAFT_1727331 [Phellopilus nigrolimitatus]